MKEQLFVGDIIGEVSVLQWTMEGVHCLNGQWRAQGTRDREREETHAIKMYNTGSEPKSTLVIIMCAIQYLYVPVLSVVDMVGDVSILRGGRIEELYVTPECPVLALGTSSTRPESGLTHTDGIFHKLRVVKNQDNICV